MFQFNQSYPRFEKRHADADLLAMLDGGVPPLESERLRSASFKILDRGQVRIHQSAVPQT